MIRKAGYKTSEFWFTVVSFIFSGLYLLGIIGESSQKEELIGVVSHAVESIILISGQVIILAKYIKGRQEEKLRQQEIELLQTEAKSNASRRKKTSTNNSKQSNTTKSKQSTSRKKSSNK